MRRYTVQVRQGAGWRSDVTSRRAQVVRDRMLWLTRSPRARCLARVVDHDGRPVVL